MEDKYVNMLGFSDTIDPSSSGRGDILPTTHKGGVSVSATALGFQLNNDTALPIIVVSCVSVRIGRFALLFALITILGYKILLKHT